MAATCDRVSESLRGHGDPKLADKEETESAKNGIGGALESQDLEDVLCRVEDHRGFRSTVL